MEIQHEMERQRFVSYSNGQESVLEYRLLADHGIDFTRTFVPEPLRGHGIAEKLVRSAIAWAREQGFNMQASCWYAKRFLRHVR
ncbi:MAG: N-acetyltransferase [Gammaproteobacteria bacterium]|nr:N-acetyltransferase [Gammaproteobacteria bacterium]